jgi:hypothetical protein
LASRAPCARDDAGPAAVGGGLSCSAVSERYQIEGLIARGGMAEVHLARMAGPAGFQKRVALKRILRAYAGNPQLTAMFLDEARLAAQLSHPNVVQVFDFGEGEDGYFIAMEYVPGPDLSGVLRALRHLGERPPEAPMLDVVLQTLRGLEHAHRLTASDGSSLGVIHRDVSPGNVLLTREGGVKLSDFGVARTAERLAETTQAGKTRGKAAYMSPEQARSRPLDARSDLFSTGLLLWEALSGQRCYAAPEEAALIRMAALGEVRPLAAVGVAVDPVLAAILERALQVDPARRFPSAGAMAEALEAYHRATYPAYTAATGLGALVGRALSVLPPLAHLQVRTPEEVTRAGEGEWKPDLVRAPPLPASPEAVEEEVVTDPAARAQRPGAASAPVRRPRPAVEATSFSVSSPSAEAPAAVSSPETDSAPAALEAPRVARASPLKLITVVVGVALLALGGLYLLDHQPDPQTTTQVVLPSSAPPSGPPPPRPVAAPHPEARAEHAVEVRTPTAAPTAAPAHGHGGTGTLSVKCDPWCEIYVDGKDTHRRSPAEDIALPAGSHALRLVNPPTTLQKHAHVVIKSGENLSRYFNLVLDR